MLSRQQQAAVIYLAIPKEERPMGPDQFATQVCGVAKRTIQDWARNNNEFKDALKTAKAEYRRREGDLFAQAARARAMMILMNGMSTPGDDDAKRKAASAVLKQVKDTPNAADTVSYKAYSDSQLISEMFGRGFNLPSNELEAFAGLVGMEDLT